VNLNPASTKVLIYLEGGGACWDSLTCYSLQTASFFTTGYSATDFASESTDASYLAQPGAFFDRSAPGNPFADYSYVYLPYCTGDVFAGNNVTTFGSDTAHFVGYANVAAYLRRVVPTFASATQVVLAGSSAGGFGALYNWGRVQAAFGAVPVMLIDDSGTLMPPDVQAQGAGYQATQAVAWNVASTVPSGCAGCSTDLDALYGYYAQEFPNGRASLLSYIQDSVLPSYYGISSSQFATGLQEEIASTLSVSPTWRYFTVNASGHVLWFSPQTTPTTTSTVTVEEFIALQVTNDAGWSSEHP
jgi:hypothetical protein